MSEQLGAYGFRRAATPSRRRSGLGEVQLANLVATALGRSTDTIVVMAHRDDTGRRPGANDNASGTAALVELARGYARADRSAAGGRRPTHTIVFLSTDGGAYGHLGAARFAVDPAVSRTRSSRSSTSTPSPVTARRAS